MVNPLRIKFTASAKHIVAKRGKQIVLIYNYIPTNNWQKKANWLERLMFS